NDGTAGDAGQARPGVGGMGGGLLVTHVDNANPGVDTAVVDVNDVPTAEREDRLDPLGLESPGNKVSPRHGARRSSRVPLNRRGHDLAPQLLRNAAATCRRWTLPVAVRGSSFVM